MAEKPEQIEELPLNQADDVRNDVAEAIKQLKGDEPEPIADETPQDIEITEVSKPERERAPDGTFVKAEKKAKTEAAPEKAAPEETPPKDAAKPSTEAPKPTVAAPVSWAADVKAMWSTLPPAIQNAVLKREAEITNGGRQWSEEKRRYESTLAPLVEETRRLGISPDQGLNALLAAHHKLNHDPASAIAELAQQYGVDLATLAVNPPAPQPPRFDPMVSQLTNHVTQLESQINGFLQNQTLGVVEQFAKDHPHYSEVEDEIAKLIPFVQQSNPHLPAHEVLNQAYEQAIWLNPNVRDQLISEKSSTAQQTQAQAIKDKAQKSAKAAVSVKGSSNGASPPKNQAPTGGDVYDDVRAAINQLRQ